MSDIRLMPKPNLFVVGAMKAGTTALYSCLKSHPRIYMSPIKEPNYFSDDLWVVSSHIRIVRSEDIERLVMSKNRVIHTALVRDNYQYQLLFPNDSGDYAYRGEASPSYLRSQKAALNISKSCPDAKIIAIIRDPVERAWSHFLMERNESRVPYLFRDLIQQEIDDERTGRISQHGILESGLYYRMLTRFYEYFDLSSILIIDYDDLRDVKEVFKKLDSSLGFTGCCYAVTSDSNRSLAPRYTLVNYMLATFGVKSFIRKVLPDKFIDMGKSKYYNNSKQPNGMSNADLAYLLSYYSQDVTSLVKMMRHTPPKWAEKYL